MKKVTYNIADRGFGEPSSSVKFGFVERLKDGSYESLHQRTSCRGYMNDILSFDKKTRKVTVGKVSSVGWNRPKQYFKDKDEVLIGLKGIQNIDQFKNFIHQIEDFFGIKYSSIEEVDGYYSHIITVDPIWISRYYMISLLLLIARCLSDIKNVKEDNFFEFMKTAGREGSYGDIMYIRSIERKDILNKIKELNFPEDMNEPEIGPHNCGISNVKF